MPGPPPEVLEKARDAIARGAPARAVVQRLRHSYELAPDLEAELTGERIVRNDAGEVIFDAARPGQTPRPLGVGERVAEAAKAGAAAAVAMPLGAAEQLRVGIASTGLPGFGDPNERRVFGRIADRLRRYAAERTDEADPRYDLPLALDEILQGVPQGLGALTVAALSGPGFYATVPAMVGGGVYDETGDAGEALKAAGIAGATTLGGAAISQIPSRAGRLGVGAGADALLARGLGQDAEGMAANVVLGFPFNVGYTGARPMDRRRVTPVDPVARQGVLDAFKPPAEVEAAAPIPLPRPELQRPDAPAITKDAAPLTEPGAPITESPEAITPATPAPAAPATSSGRRLLSPMETEIDLPGGGSVRARFAMVEADDLIPSHRADNFQPRPDYPERVQERLYHSDPAEQAKVVANADRWKPSHIYNDAPLATTGAPIITPRNIVLGGNSRAMSEQRIAAGAARTPPELLRRTALLNAERFGFSPDDVAAMRNPVLARVIENAPTNADDAAVLVRRLNDDFTQEVGSVARGVSLARSLTDRSLRVFQAAVDNGSEELPSIKSALARNRQIVDALRADGIISDQNQSLYVRKDTGHLTTDGMRLAEDTFLGRVVPDADVINARAPSMRARLLRAVPAILHAETAAPEAGFARLIDGAVRSEILRDVTGDTIDDFLAQTSLTPMPSQLDPAVAGIHRALLLPKPNDTRDAFARFARRAAEVASGQGDLLGGRRTMADAFEAVFGARPPHGRGIVDGGEEVSNDVPFGQDPEIISGRGTDGVAYGRGGRPVGGEPGEGGTGRAGPPASSGEGGGGGPPPGAPRPGGVGGPPAGAEGTPGRGFGVEVAPDAEYAGRHSATVLGPDDAAFVDQVLTDPDWGRALEERRGGRITLAEAEALGRRWGMTPEQAANLPQRTILPVEGEAKLRQLAQAATARVRTRRTELEEAMRSGDPRRMASAQTAMEIDTREAAKILMAYEAVGSEAGRSLGYRSRDSRRTRAELLARRGLRMVMDDASLTPEQRDSLAAEIVAAGDDHARLLGAIRNTYLPKWHDKLMELRVNNLVSSPVTITRNVVGNSAGVASRLVENATGYLIDLPFEVADRVRGAPGSANRRRAREITADVAGSMHGAIEGARLAWGALRDENVALSQGRIPEEAIRLPAIEGRLGVALRFPTRIQSAADLFFYQVNAEGRRYQLAMRQAVNEGNRGGAATARARELIEASRGVDLAVAERVSRGTLKPKDDAERIAGSAHGYAQEYTFRKPLERYGQAAEQLRQAPGAAGGTTRLVIPFFRTPVNLAKFTAQRSVAGFFSPRNWRDLASGDRERATSSMARLGLGTGIAYALSQVALSGGISGAGPEEPAARDALRRTGWQPHSLRIGDTWYSYRGFSPVSEQLAAAAELAETWAKSPTGEVDLEALQRIGLAIARTNLEQPMWTGVADIVNAVRQSDEAFGERKSAGVVSNLVTGTVVPRSVAWAARTADPLQRKYGETFLDQMLQQVPGAREITVPFRDPLGRAFESGSGALAAFVPHTSDSGTAPLDRWLVAIQESPDRAAVDYPSRTQLGRRLGPEVYDQLLQARGELLLPALEAIRQQTQGRGAEGEFAARKAVRDAASDLGRVALQRILPDAELEALGVAPSEPARAAVLAVLNTPAVRNVYEAPERTDREKLQLLELVQRAGSDPRAAAALRDVVLGVAPRPEPAAP